MLQKSRLFYRKCVTCTFDFSRALQTFFPAGKSESPYFGKKLVVGQKKKLQRAAGAKKIYSQKLPEYRLIAEAEIFNQEVNSSFWKSIRQYSKTLLTSHYFSIVKSENYSRTDMVLSEANRLTSQFTKKTDLFFLLVRLGINLLFTAPKNINH